MKWHHNQGTTLLEVLVSLIIFSIGFLALAKVQLLTLHSNTFNSLRMTAYNQAYNLAEQFQVGGAGQSGIFNDWNRKNAQGLPGGMGTVDQRGNATTITVYWDSTTENIFCKNDRSQQHCVQVTVWI